MDDDDAEPGGDEVLTGEIVMRDASPAPSTDVEPAAGAEGWLVDQVLFPPRPPIASHRRTPGVTVPLIMAAVVVIVGAVAWVAVGHIGRGVPPVSLASPRSVDVGAPTGPRSPSATSGAGSQSTVPPVSGGHAPRASTASAPAPSGNPGPPAASTPPTAGAPLILVTNAPTLVTKPADGMVVRVVSLTSGQSMSIANNSTNDGAPIVQSTATSTVELWKLVGVTSSCFYLINQYSGKALDEPDGTRANGTQMQQWAYGIGNVNQIWCLHSLSVDGQFSIQSIRTGSLLDLRDGGAGGGVIQQWSGNPRKPDQDQTWVLLAVA